MKSISRTIILMLLFSVSSTQASQDTNDLKIYIETLIDEGYTTFNDPKLSDAQKNTTARELIRSHLYLDWMANYALGRHRRSISSAKLDEFIKVYSQFVIKAYSDLSSSYSGEKAVLKNIRQIEDDMFIINMEILRPSGQSPIKVDYLVHKIDGNKKDPYRISDIITEGISILNSQQAEFNSVISTRGIDSLIDELRNRTYSKKESSRNSS
ncbi:MAG: ABC transporter substrate-binding protein [Rickettsiaceae bacterium]|nr:ABC transporter substrate-binding protein [Rickettsiaceae bacterium]MDP4832217.1 ABC transporter substrate-binding protein [Rickettsiaceae bacterium]MDP5020995.1 ABC transporter substrate-binding protein [Rickettsiaceae bacterium]MDP5082664.1 ABC transporter substrate-binding protein [Rickettsiaceae bacterium]